MQRTDIPTDGPSRPPAGAQRALGCLTALLIFGLLLSACGSSAPAGSTIRPTAEGATRAQFVAFATCMRSHGVPGYPDPKVTASGSQVQVTISPGTANPNSPAFRSADHGCHTLLPNGGRPTGGVELRAQNLTFANCMRAHGVPNFPDADRDGAFTLPASVSQQAPQFVNAAHACASVTPSSLSLNQAHAGS